MLDVVVGRSAYSLMPMIEVTSTTWFLRVRRLSLCWFQIARDTRISWSVSLRYARTRKTKFFSGPFTSVITSGIFMYLWPTYVSGVYNLAGFLIVSDVFLDPAHNLVNAKIAYIVSPFFKDEVKTDVQSFRAFSLYPSSVPRDVCGLAFSGHFPVTRYGFYSIGTYELAFSYWPGKCQGWFGERALITRRQSRRVMKF